MVNELVEIIGLFRLGYTRQAFDFLSKVLHKALYKETFQEILGKLYDFALEIIAQKQYKLALQLLKVLEDLSGDIKDMGKLCDIKNNMSFCYRVSEMFNESLGKCLEALEIVTQHQEIRGKLPALHLNACAIYREDLQDLKNARTHAELAYYFAKETFSPNEACKRNLAVCIYNYAFICDELNDFQNADKWYKEALDYCEKDWKDSGFIENLHFKIRHLQVKLRLLNKRVKATGIPEVFIRNRNSANSPFKGNNQRRKMLFSQCSKRVRRYSPNNSTPVPRTSISSHEKSTEHSVYSQEPVFKYRNLRTISKRIVLKPEKIEKPEKHKSLTRLVEDLTRNTLEITEKVLKIQKCFRGWVCRKKIHLKKNIIAKKVRINQKKYLIFLVFSGDSVTIEAFNTESLLQINKQEFKRKEICDAVGIPLDSWQKYSSKICSHISVERRKIIFKGRNESIIYDGVNYLNGEKFQIVIKFIDENDKSLIILAKNHKGTNTYTFALDPLQDPENIRKKIPFILSKLKMKEGELKFAV